MIFGFEGREGGREWFDHGKVSDEKGEKQKGTRARGLVGLVSSVV